jgi:hypothetical protein
MASVFAFLGMLLISLLVALLAALQLGDFFLANDEFVVVIAIVAAFAPLAMAVFAIGYRRARDTRLLNWLALVLALVALTPVALPGGIRLIASLSTNPYTVGVENTYITLELVIPALLAVLVQWGLVRRRWLRTSGEKELAHWPWITTGIGCLVILSPIGLAFVGGTLKHAGGDFMWPLIATMTGSALGLLLVMTAVECYIRERMLRRRPAANPPSGMPRQGGKVQAAG